MKNFLLILEWIFLILALVIFTIVEDYQESVVTGLAILAGSFSLRALRHRRILPQTGLEIPWLLGLTSAGIAAWIAYDRSIAVLQFSRLLAAFVLYFAVVDLPPGLAPWTAGGFLAMAASLAIYFPIQYNFAKAPLKIAVINQWGAWFHTTTNSLFAQIPFTQGFLEPFMKDALHPNVAAGTLSVAIPFGIALAWSNFQKRGKPLNLLAGVLVTTLTLIIFGGLILTTSRGALMALIVTGLIAGLTIIQRQWFKAGRERQLFWAIVLLSGVLFMATIMATGSLNRLVGGVPDPTGTIQSRTELWKQGLDLIGDYGFTGSGLMSFWMVHGGYNLQLFIPFIAHVHNTFLETWIEQGVLGVAALVIAGLVIISWFWKADRRQHVPLLGWAGMAALCIAFFHGTVDVVFSVSRTLPVTGFLFGFAWFVNLNPDWSVYRSKKDSTRPLPEWVLITTGILVSLIIGVIALFWQPLLSAWYANLAAVSQTRLELSIFDPVHFESLSLDDIRQNAPPEQIEPIYAAFTKSLSLNPKNRTSLQRLAQIAFSRGEYPQSLAYTQQLWDSGYRDATTRILYGDALIANEDLASAAKVLRGLTWAENHLMAIAWYRYWIAGDSQRAANIWQVVLDLNPGNSDANYWLKEAQAILNTNSSP